jgi:DNA (cytosine-5)-methyltransferase 1
LITDRASYLNIKILSISVNGKQEFDEMPSENTKYPTKFKAIELFAGIGGIRAGFERAFKDRIEFVWANDINQSASVTYEANYGKGSINTGDITQIIEKDISQVPAHDILLAGFPCQPFSIAGWQKGFEDETRGTLFYAIEKILAYRQPPIFFLENVKHFEHHDGGRTWRTVHKVLTDKLGYTVFAQCINAKYFGVPQNRPRFFMVGFKEKDIAFEFPKETISPPPLSRFLEPQVDKKYYLSQQYLNTLIKHRARHESKGNGFGYIVLDRNKDIANTIVVGGMGRERNLIRDAILPDCWKLGNNFRMKKNNQGIRQLTPREYARLQGYAETFVIPVCNTQAWKQFANSVAVPAVEAVAKNILNAITGKRKSSSQQLISEF